MYLKSIEIHGFKSFANKINFQFHNGITGIVGPNGSGKSNVADAVRWVLGEQKIKQLRSSSMQDVIFSGTEARKPLSYAYVAITLDNADHQLAIDYDEVTVARRIYRSGESEYLINGTICRLRDVNELFYDTGIGKEGYSIIGQGQIDKIISGKPEERRELFDEAAGIVKFKKRKSSAVTKLENEKQNLVRVTDILKELERQVGPLGRQAEVAKVYLNKREELKTLDVNVFLLESVRLREQLSQIEEKYNISDAQLKETNEQYEAIKTDYEQVQSELEALEVAMEEARKTLNESGLVRSRLEGEINVLKEKINSAQGNENHLNTRKQSLEGEIALRREEQQKTGQEKDRMHEDMERLSKERDSVREELKAVQQKIASLNEEIEKSKNTIIGELNQRATIRSKMGSFDTMTEQIHIRKAELNARLLRAKSDEAQREENIKKLEKNFEEVTKQIQDLNEECAAAEITLGKIREELQEKDNKLRETQTRFHQEKSKLEALNNLTERYEGYGGSVKKVMEQKDTYKGIIGVVADIIQVEQKYETAIEIALGGNIQNVVTDNEETAKKVIQFLKNNRLGRATFLPLTSITHPQEFKTPEVLSEKGVIGMADELTYTKPEYKNVAKAMLGRIVVVDHIDNAVRIAKKYDYGVRMVTLEGELLVPGGAISGGTFKNNSNLLGRRRELEELEEKIASLEKEIKRISDDIEETKKKRNELRLSTELKRGELQRKGLEQNTAKLSLSAAKDRMAEEEQGYDSMKKEEAEIEEQLKKIQEDKNHISEELSGSEKLEQEMQDRIAALKDELDAERNRETQKAKTVSEWEVKVEKINSALEYQQGNFNRIEEEINRLNGELDEIIQALKDNDGDVEENKQKILAIQETIAASFDQQNESEVFLKEGAEKKEKLTTKQRNFFNTREELGERRLNLEGEVLRLKTQKEATEGAMESQINYMWDEYEITLSDATAMRNEEMNDLSAMKKSISTLKDEIKKLGNVNVNAIEDYKELMERYTFTKQQHDDLVEAEKTLEGIIAELDEAMRKQFKEKFADICHEFDKVFRELFGGGKGTLELMEDEDMLEAGIRIIAQPPGKKLQNMMQLSGGEKALTAIALLFAIQNLKPSPFCLLDEIEAALDESNVSRYAKYLHKLTKHTQFIVITHRRGTMESADRLYGITMQEKGVSTLVSVNLVDKDLT